MEQDVSNKLNWHMGIKRDKEAEKERDKAKQRIEQKK